MESKASRPTWHVQRRTQIVFQQSTRIADPWLIQHEQSQHESQFQTFRSEDPAAAPGGDEADDASTPYLIRSCTKYGLATTVDAGPVAAVSSPADDDAAG